MTYRRLKADGIFDGERILKDKVLVVEEDGTVASIVSDNGEGTQDYRGILCPGLINCHCHLELSHLKGKVPPGKGMVDFLISIVYARRNAGPGHEKAISRGEQDLWENGVNGIADICNTAETIDTKKRSRIRWHNLVEVINFFDSTLQNQMETPRKVLDAFRNAGMPAVFTPHAPYSVSGATYDLINAASPGQVISIHNQESRAENNLFLSGKSDFLTLYTEFGDGLSPFPVTGKSSLLTWLPHFNNGQTILVVHNSYISETDIDFAMDHAAKYGLTLVFCLCPNANLYIEGVVPPVELLMKKECTIVVGTDSYGSNYQLSPASELKTLKEHFPFLSTETLLKWATANGADALRWKDLGRFTKGTRPGIILLNDSDFSVTRII